MAQYDGEIAYGDRELGRFLRELRARGRYDDALVVFLADHGEEFLDHGQWLHGRSVFDELVRVPLVVKWPGQRGAGQRVAEQVQVVDVLPTVLESLGLPRPPAEAMAGRPLPIGPRTPPGERPALSEISHRGIVAHGLRTNADKYVRRFSPESDELYFDLAKDPREQASAAGTRPERERFLRDRVEASFVPNPFRYVARAAGTGEYRLAFHTSGAFLSPQGAGLGPGETYELGESGRSLAVVLRPRTGAPRELSFNVRPRGAPVRVAGTRDGRPLRPRDVSPRPGRLRPRRGALHPPAARGGERASTPRRPVRLGLRDRAGPRPLAGDGPGPRRHDHGQGDLRTDAGSRLRGFLCWLMTRTVHEVRAPTSS